MRNSCMSFLDSEDLVQYQSVSAATAELIFAHSNLKLAFKGDTRYGGVFKLSQLQLQGFFLRTRELSPCAPFWLPHDIFAT